MQAIDAVLADPTRSTLIKQDNNTIAKAQIDGRWLVVKRHNAKSFWRFFKRMFGPSRAIKNWLRAHDLLALHIATPTPIAAMTKEIGPIKLRSYYLYEFLEAPTVEDFFIQCQDPKLQKQVAQQIADIFVVMFNHGLCQRDTGPANMLVQDGQVYMIDIEGILYFRGITPLKAQQKSLNVFLDRWQQYPELQNLFMQTLQTAGLDLPKSVALQYPASRI